MPVEYNAQNIFVHFGHPTRAIAEDDSSLIRQIQLKTGHRFVSVPGIVRYCALRAGCGKRIISLQLVSVHCLLGES